MNENKVNQNTPELASWLAGAQELIVRFFERNCSVSNPVPKLSLSFGQKYAKVLREGSAHAFIDLSNGDVLKPASWSRPAKHARGNIFDANNGLAGMQWTGPAYLR